MSLALYLSRVRSSDLLELNSAERKWLCRIGIGGVLKLLTNGDFLSALHCHQVLVIRGLYGEGNVKGTCDLPRLREFSQATLVISEGQRQSARCPFWQLASDGNATLAAREKEHGDERETSH
jgi:hypothetical protein